MRQGKRLPAPVSYGHWGLVAWILHCTTKPQNWKSSRALSGSALSRCLSPAVTDEPTEAQGSK